MIHKLLNIKVPTFASLKTTLQSLPAIQVSATNTIKSEAPIGAENAGRSAQSKQDQIYFGTEQDELAYKAGLAKNVIWLYAANYVPEEGCRALLFELGEQIFSGNLDGCRLQKILKEICIDEVQHDHLSQKLRFFDSRAGLVGLNVLITFAPAKTPQRFQATELTVNVYGNGGPFARKFCPYPRTSLVVPRRGQPRYTFQKGEGEVVHELTTKSIGDFLQKVVSRKAASMMR